jgi:hypothetical protein
LEGVSSGEVGLDPALESLTRYLRKARGKVIRVDRPGSRRRRFDLRINYFDEDSGKVSITFVGGRSNGLPLYFWMFERVVESLRIGGGFVPIGARLAPPYIEGSLEAAVWVGKKSPYKSAPHLCDILADAGLVAYGEARSPETGRRVQAARLLGAGSPPPIGSPIPGSSRPDRREKDDEQLWIRVERPPVSSREIGEMRKKFLAENGSVIIQWTKKNALKIKHARESYTWGKKSVETCVKERNQIAQALSNSRVRYKGAVDLGTLDLIIKWGFNRKFPLRDEKQALDLTKEAFERLDRGDVGSAALTLMDVRGVGISRASKILGLSDQENLCIFDSRVGNALRDLENCGIKLVRCPPGRVKGRVYEILSSEEWAEDYRKAVWTVQAIRDKLRSQGLDYTSADVEMALFMMGK